MNTNIKYVEKKEGFSYLDGMWVGRVQKVLCEVLMCDVFQEALLVHDRFAICSMDQMSGKKGTLHTCVCHTIVTSFLEVKDSNYGK